MYNLVDQCYMIKLLKTELLSEFGKLKKDGPPSTDKCNDIQAYVFFYFQGSKSMTDWTPTKEYFNWRYYQNSIDES